MEFMNRGASQPAAARVSGNGGAAPAGAGAGKRGGRWKESPLWLRVVWIVLLFSATIVVAALAVLLYFGGSKEADLVDKSKHQAVFLTNGQVYFGKVRDVNGKYLNLTDIYYLNVNQRPAVSQEGQEGQTNSISLVKLGCELHGPVDRMVINRDQVTFWENLRDEGQVAKAIADWVSKNPNGQTCQTNG